MRILEVLLVELRVKASKTVITNGNVILEGSRCFHVCEPELKMIRQQWGGDISEVEAVY